MPTQSQPAAKHTPAQPPQPVAAHTPNFPHLEEIPYETNDKAGGYYLHFSEEGDSLYISKQGNTDRAFRDLSALVAENKRLREAAKTALAALQNLHELQQWDKQDGDRIDEAVDAENGLRAALAKEDV